MDVPLPAIETSSSMESVVEREAVWANTEEVWDREIISEETKMALAEMAYCFGVFDEQSVEIGGKSKHIGEVTSEERRSGRAIDSKKRVEQILEMVHQEKLTNENLHMMFDGTNMEYNPAF